MLTPEKCIEMQNAIGADIIMQLDDVVKTTTTGPRVEEAMHRLVSIGHILLFLQVVRWCTLYYIFDTTSFVVETTACWFLANKQKLRANFIRLILLEEECRKRS